MKIVSTFRSYISRFRSAITFLLAKFFRGICFYGRIIKINTMTNTYVGNVSAIYERDVTHLAVSSTESDVRYTCSSIFDGKYLMCSGKSLVTNLRPEIHL
jgi:hypothetical protein